MIAHYIEKLRLRTGQLEKVEGTLCFDKKVLELFLSAPYDMLPDFTAPSGTKLRRGRGKDHPRYGRFVYAFARYCKPDYIVEVGTYAAGTAVGWAKALAENAAGTLICIDNDTYSKGTYPEIARTNIEKTGLSESRYMLLNGDSKVIIPELAKKHENKVDIYLVDGDHTFEGALADIENGLPMVKSGGYILVHDVDTGRMMAEATDEHQHPVYEAFIRFINEYNFRWCLLRFIRKHLGVIKVY